MMGERMIEVLNKIDRIEPEAREALLEQAKRHHPAVAISAINGEGCDRLIAMIESKLRNTRFTQTYRLPHEQGAAGAWLYEHGEVQERRDEEDYFRVDRAPHTGGQRAFRAPLRLSGAELPVMTERGGEAGTWLKSRFRRARRSSPCCRRCWTAPPAAQPPPNGRARCRRRSRNSTTMPSIPTMWHLLRLAASLDVKSGEAYLHDEATIRDWIEGRG